jgi:hypothetical protein
LQNFLSFRQKCPRDGCIDGHVFCGYACSERQEFGQMGLQ